MSQLFDLSETAVTLIALAIAGSFTTIAGQPARGIAIGDGTSWFTPDGGIRAHD